MYLYKAWDYRLIIGEWAVQSLKAVINDGSHASFFVNRPPEGATGGE